MKLICYPTSGEPPLIRPAPGTRDWMDATPEGYAYRCLPLNIANAHGWEVLCPSSFMARWSGKRDSAAIAIQPLDGRPAPAISHFGDGVMTFHVNGLFRTEPGYGLMVGGPINRLKDGIQALSGVIETDWAPFTFTMNWKFTRAGLSITFEEGEPFCHLFPVKLDLVETIEPEIRDMSEDQDLVAQYRAWTENRNKFNADLKVEGSEARQEKWQKVYYQGKDMTGNRREGHLTKLRPHPFKDRRQDKPE